MRRLPFIGIQTISALLAVGLLFAAPLSARAGDTTPPELTHNPPIEVPGQPIHVLAHITDESRIFPQLFVRYGVQGQFEAPIDMKKSKAGKDEYEADIPYRGGPIDYYLECYDEFGNGPATAGNGEHPLHVIAAARAKSEANSLALPEFSSGDHPAAGESSPRGENGTSDSAPGATSPSLSLRLVEPPPLFTREEATWHSLIVPGWGQYRSERRVRGVAFGVATGGSLIAALWLTGRAAQANNVYQDAPVSVRGEALSQARDYAHARNAMFAVALGLWAFNVAEAWFRYGNKDPW